ncbi:4-hydroxy-tetrahydrodipicolinate synthase [Paenibacillus solanacearum]|uniref:4-hydroxy-tetrahydrodipicolinate synthase n=2 Tax=Paenibacillus solanacearum TaxID=2048548 RepID=A0A916NNE0_9BACL|nr:4-hydroxy-tetrahydrodipicolinate synthase [Paenibacillus solanacearum]
MKPMQAHEIAGNWGTVMLPIREDDSIDFVRLEQLVDRMAALGLNGIYTNGTAGEFYTQSEEEFIRVSELTADRCHRYGMPFQIGASHMSPQLSLERIKRAAAYRPSAIQVVLSDWFPLQDDEAADCLKRMAEAADGIGLVLYNPPHAKRVLTPEAYGKLKKEVPGLVGIKCAGGDAAWYAAMKEYAHGISIFVPGHHLATGIALGAHGAYSNVACLQPLGAQRWYDTMLTDLPKALELESRIQRFMANHIAPFIMQHGYCNAACDKLMSVIGGVADVGCRMRWPYRSIPASEAERLRPVACELIPEIMNASA